MIGKKSIVGFVAVAALALLLAPAAAQAQAVIKVGDTASINFGFQFQGWADWTQDAVTSGYSQNLYLRRIRFLVGGQVAKNVTFFMQTDNPNLGKVNAGTKTISSGLIVQDALVTWKIDDAFRLEGGMFLVPLSRNGLQSTTQYFTLDISPTATVFAGPTATNGLRDTGFQARGYFLDRKQLEYRVAVQQGVRDAASRNPFRLAGFVNYNFFETENGYVLKGTNLGKRKVLSLSAGVDTQKSYSAYSGNLFATIPVAKGDELGGQLQWVHYDGSDFLTSLPRQNDYLAEVAYYINSAKVQPFAKYEAQKFSDTANQSKDVSRWGIGLNYLIANQNLKLTAQYQRVEPDSKSGIASTNQFTLQLQVFYF